MTQELILQGEIPQRSSMRNLDQRTLLEIGVVDLDGFFGLPEPILTTSSKPRIYNTIYFIFHPYAVPGSVAKNVNL
ncbi:MAG: hypothetical protein ACI8PB_005165 [Desulforhopalus sp.]|jgi:hypothetical protein